MFDSFSFLPESYTNDDVAEMSKPFTWPFGKCLPGAFVDTRHRR
jgi:hypothetical protein